MENLWMFLQQTAAASLTALFLLLLQRIFLDKLSPRWQYGVWLVLLLRLLVPVNSAGRTSVLDVSFWVELLRTHTELPLSSVYSSPFRAARPEAPVPFPPTEVPISWTDWLFFAYCAGVVLWTVWYLFCALRLALRVRGGVPVVGSRRAAIAALAERHRLPVPKRVVECRWEHSPFLLGALRPVLVLPMGWELDEKVVLHELLHLKYQDVWAGWLTMVFRCIHWCNPFLWLVFDKIGNDREALCDQRVLERLSGEERRDYGRVLLSMADDRQVHTPGATTMANGARAVKARIQAIARFKRFPQGMGLVSGCIVAVLSLSLVAGVPAKALSAGQSVAPPEEFGVSGILAAAVQNRPVTVAGALDAYGKAIYHRYHAPATALLCSAMVTPEKNMPEGLERYMSSAFHREDEALLDRWWRAGPTFRGLSSDGAGGYLCQVFWFRDKDIPESEIPEVLSLYPVEYLCHTVRIRPDGASWTVEKLAETQGDFEVGVGGTLFYWHENLLYGPVTWSGEANGVSVELSPGTTFLTTDQMTGEDTLTAYANGRVGTTFFFFFGGPEDSPAVPTDPIPNAAIRNFDENMRMEVGNPGGITVPIRFRAEPSWNDPQILPDQNHAASLRSVTPPLPGPGETEVFALSSGGGSGDLGDPMELYVGPDSFVVTAQIGDGEPFPIPMTPRYTTPDGGTFTLHGEEAVP